MKNKSKILLILISMLGLVLLLAGCVAASPGGSSSADGRMAVPGNPAIPYTSLVTGQVRPMIGSLVRGLASVSTLNPPNLQSTSGDKLVLGGVYTLDSGETLTGSLIVLGGSVTLEAGSTVTGDVVLLGGSMIAQGTIEGDLFSMGGSLELSDTSVIQGDLNTLGGSAQGVALADVQGDVVSDESIVMPIPINGLSGIRLPNIPMQVNPLWGLLWFMIQTLLWAAIAVVVVLFLPRPTQRVSQAVVAQPLVAGGLGFLTVVVAPFVLLFLVIIIIGIPVALIAVLLLVAAWAFGFIAIGAEVGKRLAQMSKADWALPVSAGLGTFLLALITYGIGEIVPCVGWIVPFLVGITGLGAVILTRFGTLPYPRTVEDASMAVADTIVEEPVVKDNQNEPPVTPGE